MKKYIYFIVSLALLSACKPEVEEFEASSGSADFSKYVAVGNSLTAGYANGALYKSGQEYSYPNILAQQFAKAGGGSFKQPYIESETGIGFVGTTPVTKRTLAFVTDCKGVTSLAPTFTNASLTVLAPPVQPGPYNNLGVPAAKSFHLLSGAFGAIGTGNPYYSRFATNPGTSTVVQDAMVQNPTFFTLWIGSNDILLYAVGGGEEAKNITASDTATHPNIVAASISRVVDSLTKNGAKGAIANIPDITDIPYFTTIPYNGLTLDAASASALNTAYTGTGITFSEGKNAFIIADASATLGFRKIKSNEYVLLTTPQDSIKCKGWGSSKPIPANYILDETEIAKVVSYTNSYNTSISTIAATKGLAFVNTNALMKSLKGGFPVEGIDFNATYVTGNAFSLDGIHLTPRGYAVVANEFIKAINSQFSANVPQVNVADYPGLQFPE